MDALPLIPARPAPTPTHGLWLRLRRSLFASAGSTVLTLALLAATLWLVPQLWSWGVVHAVFERNADACQAARDNGACWGVIAEKYRVILFGGYPFDEQWRPLAATALLLTLLVFSCLRVAWRRWLILAWVVVLALFVALMGGGVAGLTPVPTQQWGGLPLTLLLASASSALAFPLSVLIALGRRSELPAIRAVCTGYVELVRGVPLISVLFMASFLFPLLLPVGASPDVLLRVLAGITLFAAAYMAEIVRGGLQAIPRGQIEAAHALGLGYWRTQRLVVLPQALATVLPGLMNNFIGIFKDTSLVTVVSLYELTGAAGMALAGDPTWRPFKVEAYLLIAAIYFAFCFAMSRYSLRVERSLKRTHD